MQSGLVIAVDDDPPPIVPQTVIEQGNLHYDRARNVLNPGPNRVEDIWVSYRLQGGQLPRILEHDRCQGGSVDLSVNDHPGPSRSHLGRRRPVWLEHEVTDAIGIDRRNARFLQESAHRALSTPDPTAENPASLHFAHQGER